ncbi:MAG TPA: 2'-5' RNA ligase family protein [Bryobacteraceae bacterium]|nr:2'-5' RNA ligase family protein [Bryobacteraceae bacterium]
MFFEENAFTLVAYLPDPLRSWLIELRRTLPLVITSEPHLTVLPPRPLSLPIEEVTQKLSAILNHWASFTVELSSVRVFSGSNVLFLEVNQGGRTLELLHAELNQDEFAHEEEFPFHPHVTIGAIGDSHAVEEIKRLAQVAWNSSQCPPRFPVTELALVALRGREEWTRLWEYRLCSAAYANQT